MHQSQQAAVPSGSYSSGQGEEADLDWKIVELKLGVLSSKLCLIDFRSLFFQVGRCGPAPCGPCGVHVPGCSGCPLRQPLRW